MIFHPIVCNIHYGVIFMKNYILLKSVSSALKSKDLLDKYNIKSSVERTPKNNVARSCGYSLLVYNDIDKAVKILESKRITVLGIVNR